jgi:hypothetical protein
MRIGLIIVAVLALAGFLVVAVVLPQKEGSDVKEAAQALIAGAEPAQKQIAAAAEKSANLAGSGKDVKLAAKSDPKHGELKRRGPRLERAQRARGDLHPGAAGRQGCMDVPRISRERDARELRRALSRRQGCATCAARLSPPARSGCTFSSPISS